MPRNQRMGLLGLAALVVIVAVFVSLRAGGDDPSPERASRTSSTTPAAATVPTGETPTTAAPAPEPPPPLLRAGRVRKIAVKKGDTVTFRVRHPAAENVHVHGYDLSKTLEPGKTATMSFKADIEGIFEIELENSGTQIASLKVEPR